MKRRLLAVIMTLVFAVSAVPVFSASSKTIAESSKYLKRSQFVEMLHKALDIKIMYFRAPDIKEIFKDVSNEESYAGQLYDLVTCNIIERRGDFRPNDPLTRGDMIKYLTNAYKFKMQDTATLKGKKLDKLFSDLGSTDCKCCKDKGKKSHNKQRDMKGYVTKGEAESAIKRLLSVLPKKDVKKYDVTVTPSYELTSDSLIMKIAVTNNDKREIVLEHSSSGKADFALLDAERKEIYRWSDGKFFLMMLTSTAIAPGKTVEFTEKVSREELKDVIGKAAYMKAYISGRSAQFTVDPLGYETKFYLSDNSAVKVNPSFEKTETRLKLKLSITNTLKRVITITHPTSQKYDFVLLDTDRKEIYRWSASSSFLQAVTNTDIGTETIEFFEDLDFGTYKSIIDNAVYMKAYITGSCDVFEINPNGYEVKIK